MDTLLQDLRYAVRTLLKNPGFAAVAVLCIGLGIGANTTIYSFVNAILLRPFPFAKPEELVSLRMTQLKNGVDRWSVSYPDYRDWKEQSTVFSRMEAYGGRSVTLGGKEPERVQGASVTAGLFTLLGVAPAVGRGFREDEDRAGAAPTAVLSDDLWRRRFGGDSRVVGQVIVINGVPHEVVGVMPPRFGFPENTEIWLPLVPLAQDYPRAVRDFRVIARLARGRTIEDARTDIGTIAAAVARLHPDANAGWGATALTLREEFVHKDIQRVFWTLLGAVGFVLLIACANVANLLLARATSRSRELAIRAAIGAGRGRIVRQLLTESVLIALAGGALGLFLAVWGIDFVIGALPREEPAPFWMRFTIDRGVLLYTMGITLVTGIVFGLAPAFQALDSDVHEVLKEGGRGAGPGRRRNRLRSALVVAEIALSLVLLVGASLFGRSFLAYQFADTGFDSSNMLTLRFYLPGLEYTGPGPKVRRAEDIVRRVEALPGVVSAGVSETIPLAGGGEEGATVHIDGRDFAPAEEPLALYTGVSGHFFPTLRVRPIEGRLLTEREAAESSSVAVVNELFARRFWPDGDAVGHRIRFSADSSAQWLTIVGVIATINNDDIDDPIPASVYLPLPYYATRGMGLIVRTTGDPTRLVPAVREAIRASDPNLPLYAVMSMAKARQLGFWEYGFFSSLFGVFAVLALILAAIGVYGVISYAVGQRTREIGVRVALGAQRADVFRMIVRDGLMLAVVGVVIGVVGALGATRIIASMLVNVSPTDPLSFATISLLLTAVAVLASWLPARRATTVDPVIALRAE